MARTEGQDFSRAIAKWKRDKTRREEMKQRKASAAGKGLLEDENDEDVKKSAEKESEENKKKNETKNSGSTWGDIWAKSKLLWPFLWPRGSAILQAKVVICLIILVAIRGITVLVPVYKKKIVDSMTIQYESAVSDADQDQVNDTMVTTPSLATVVRMTTTVRIHGIEFRWDYILMFIMLKALKGSYLETLRSFLWIRVSQNTRKRMRLALFSHLHSLSLQWHLSRKTGEVLRVLSRGVSSIDVVLSHVLFNIFPAIADILIGIVFFVTAFNVYIGLIVFACMVCYLVLTILLTEWRTKFRRRMNEADNERGTVNVDSILNFETVKYYAAEDWEAQRYAQALDNHLREEWTFSAVQCLQTSLQRTLMDIGMLGGCLLTAWYIYGGALTVGDYVLFTSYLEQLYGPLATFGNQYRIIQRAFVDMENMLDLMAAEADVIDSPDARPLAIEGAQIEFDRVSFSYVPNKEVLKDVSFKIPPGKTYALVGHSGSGKSTILRLLLRFYNLQNGNISIDDQAIETVTQKSLRQQIGVVPQDTVLFNNNIRYNVRYGRVTATDEEVEQAAKVADIHDRILRMHDGYNSRVGERGLKLSGGEKQRVAIARTILKNPKIVLLDEATSAFDTKTERNIQSSLARMCENRTTVLVAHRLSTVIHADHILVLEEGRIVERGSHSELVARKGLYAEMWSQQLEEEAKNVCSPEKSHSSSHPATSRNDISGHSCPSQDQFRTDGASDGKESDIVTDVNQDQRTSGSRLSLPARDDPSNSGNSVNSCMSTLGHDVTVVPPEVTFDVACQDDDDITQKEATDVAPGQETECQSHSCMDDNERVLPHNVKVRMGDSDAGQGQTGTDNLDVTDLPV